MINKVLTYIFLSFAIIPLTSMKPGTSTLEDLRSRCYELCYNVNYAALDTAATQMLEIVEEHNNNGKYAAYANFYKGVALLFDKRDKSAINYLERALDISKRIHNDTISGLAYNSMGLYYDMINDDYYVAQTCLFEALRYAKSSEYKILLAGVNGNLAQLSLMQNDTTGLQYARDCYNLGIKLNKEHSIAFGAYALAAQYMWRHEYDKALEYLRISEENYKKLGKPNAVEPLSLYATIYCDLGKLDKAQECINSVLERESENSIYRVNALLQQARLYNKRGEYSLSNEKALQALELSKRIYLWHYNIELYELRADNFIALGLKDEAIEALHQRNKVNDIMKANSEEHMRHERQMSLKIANKEKELSLKEAQVKARNLVIILLIIFLTILIGMAILILHSMKVRNGLYKRIVAQYLRAIDEQQPIIEPTLPAIDEEVQKGVVSHISDEKSLEMFRELCRIIKTDKLFTDPMLNRERLAELLGTNRTYVTQIVKDNTGMNLPQFINSYRIEEAILRLSTKEIVEIKINDLASELGFTTSSTFIRIFKNKVGMSPAEYRKNVVNSLREVASA